MNEDLPSINDFVEDNSNLPSVKDYIEKTPTTISESVENELPSYKEFVTEETVKQIEEEEVNSYIPVTADLSSVITLIEGVRNSIPEVKSYDKELYELMHLIEDLRKDIPQVKLYDEEIRELRESIPTVPEVKYYDREIQELRDSIPTVPEVKYYDQDIKELKESISEVKDRYIPDFRWIYKSFSQLDEGQENLDTSLSQIKNKLDMEIDRLMESMDVVKFETNVDTKSLDERLTVTENTITETIGEVKGKIYKELRDASLRIWKLKGEYQEDDKKLKKEIARGYKELSESISDIVQSHDSKSSEFDSYLQGLKEEISNLPEVKYYDEEIDKVNQSVKKVQNLVEVLENKLNKKIAGLKESILVVPPTENNIDPLTPLDQNFATLDDLSNHYRTFLNRIQQQLATLGGGGEVRLEFLDDIDRDTAKVDGKFLKYEASSGKWVGATGGGGGGISASGTSGQILQHNGTEYVGVSSVGIATFINDYHQGYYRYSTNFYTTGVANTVQNLPADEFVTIQPSVRTNKVDFMPEKMLIANSNDPWIGAGATIGTGQTQFSLAGLDDGSTVIVRIASQFNPDDDQTNLDFRLNFTTNPTTQGYGTTNFSITREQALICNEGADQNYISEILMNFYVGSSLSGPTKETAGSFNLQARASNEGDFEMMALTINVVA
tara:strand:- start:4347 stop:6350 length:2004 start_codon:yes stop_codon:yes gene_type:complete